MNNPWTPGPWTDDGAEMVGSDGQRVLLAAFRGGLVTANGNPEARANTRLVYAAPELVDALAALVADVAEYPAWERPCLALDNARALLARIRGDTK